MNVNCCKPGIKVKTNKVLGSTAGMLISEDKIKNRIPSSNGTIWGYVGGHGGDVWWVKHQNGNFAPYCFDEMEEVVSDS